MRVITSQSVSVKRRQRGRAERAEEERQRAMSLDDDILACLRARRRRSLASGDNDATAAMTRKEIRRRLNSDQYRNAAGAATATGADAASPREASSKTAHGKGDVKRALKRLAKLGLVTKDGKKSYRLVVSASASDGDAENEKRSGAGRNDDAAILPIAKRMRLGNAGNQRPPEATCMNEAQVEGERSGGDLDEEIRRLEAELAADDEDDDGNSSGTGSDHCDKESNDVGQMPRGNDRKAISFGANSVREYDLGNESRNRVHESDNDDVNATTNIPQGGIICLSESANDRIDPLPQSVLPQNKRRKLKGIDVPDENEGRKQRKKHKASDVQEHAVSSGLRDAVSDLLSDYVRPSSIDRPPYYCRICQHQSSTQDEFEAHKSTEFHAAAVREEKRRTYCKLCRKQLTSVVQMVEHLRSRPHRERMDYVRGGRQGKPVGTSTGRGRGGGGGGATMLGGRHKRKYEGNGVKDGRRQWC